MLKYRSPVLVISGACLAALLAATAVAAEPVQLAQADLPQAQPKTTKAPPAVGAPDSGLKQRVEQLEEQLVDMQVVVGTLESLARGGGAAAPAGGGASYAGGADSVRIDGLETQLRALSAQIQQLTDQVRALGGQPRRSDAGTAPAAPLPGLPATDTADAGPGVGRRRPRRRRGAFRLDNGYRRQRW